MINWPYSRSWPMYQGKTVWFLLGMLEEISREKRSERPLLVDHLNENNYICAFKSGSQALLSLQVERHTTVNRSQCTMVFCLLHQPLVCLACTSQRPFTHSTFMHKIHHCVRAGTLLSMKTDTQKENVCLAIL